MSGTIDLKTVVACLKSTGIDYGKIKVGENAEIVVMAHGGRILGPFIDGRGSIFWLNSAWKSPEAFAAFCRRAEWNIGGERLWISPEIQYNVSDRANFRGTFRVPNSMDPGTWKLEGNGKGSIRLSQHVTLEAHNIASGTKRLELNRTIHPLPDPLNGLRCPGRSGSGRVYSDCIPKNGQYAFCGYEQEISIMEDQSDAIVSEPWLVVQLQPGGSMLVPSTTSMENAYTDYFDPMPSANYRRHACIHEIRITGDTRFKLGFKSAFSCGRIGYLSPGSGTGDACLVVRNFANNPSALYAEEEPNVVGNRGHSIHVFNDDGSKGGFGELECMGQPIGAATGVSSRTESYQLWVFQGSIEVVGAISRVLIGEIAV